MCVCGGGILELGNPGFAIKYLIQAKIISG